MGARDLRCSLFFLFSLLLNSDSSFAEKPPMEAIWQNKELDHQNNQIFSSSSPFTSQLDNIPIINPTTPTTTTPIVNPTSPFPPTTTTPVVNPPSPPPPTTTQPTTNTPSTGAWCIASPTAAEIALQVALDYACGYGGADCSAIQPGATCYNPNTIRDHASYAFNDYYQKNPVPISCGFGGTAQLTYTDPSSGSCHYATPRTTPSISSPVIPTPTTPSAPTTYGSEPIGGFGSEPTATPSSAESMTCNLLLLLTMTCLLMSLNRGK